MLMPNCTVLFMFKQQNNYETLEQNKENEFLFHCSIWLARFCFVQSSVLFYLTSIDLNLQLCECKSNYIRINGFTAIIKIIADIFLKQILLIPRFQFAPLTN